METTNATINEVPEKLLRVEKYLLDKWADESKRGSSMWRGYAAAAKITANAIIKIQAGKVQ